MLHLGERVDKIFALPCHDVRAMRGARMTGAVDLVVVELGFVFDGAFSMRLSRAVHLKRTWRTAFGTTADGQPTSRGTTVRHAQQQFPGGEFLLS